MHLVLQVTRLEMSRRPQIGTVFQQCMGAESTTTIHNHDHRNSLGNACHQASSEQGCEDRQIPKHGGRTDQVKKTGAGGSAWIQTGHIQEY